MPTVRITVLFTLVCTKSRKKERTVSILYENTNVHRVILTPNFVKNKDFSIFTKSGEMRYFANFGGDILQTSIGTRSL